MNVILTGLDDSFLLIIGRKYSGNPLSNPWNVRKSSGNPLPNPGIPTQDLL
jgi:hypothetical protein